ncbi:MAG: PspA/IM30 family protein [Gammaproteobacteria bacterium]|nr:PspA/IM30 family protein [Gammaproteobacteria bacterium]
MSEKLTSRVGRIIAGSINALVDAVENATPEIVMQQAIREVDEAINDVKAELGKVIANKHLANQRLLEENSKHQDLSQKIELSINEKRDDLAEAAIAQQLDIEAQIPILETRIGNFAAEEKELESYVQALQAKKREMNNELGAIKAMLKESAGIGAKESTNPFANNENAENRVAKAASAFERVTQSLTGSSTNSTPNDRKTAAKLAELEELSRQNRIKERLASFKNEA